MRRMIRRAPGFRSTSAFFASTWVLCCLVSVFGCREALTVALVGDGGEPLDSTTPDASVEDAETEPSTDMSPPDAGADPDVNDLGPDDASDRGESRLTCEELGNLLVDGGFESADGSIPEGRPNRPGFWSGDSAIRRSPSRGAFSGRQALEFLATTPGVGGEARAGQVYQLVRLDGRLEIPLETPLAFVASGWFERADERVPTNDQLRIFVWAHEGSLENFPSDNPAQRDATLSQASLSSDSTPGWEFLELRAELPAGTRYVGLEIQANENAINRPRDEFQGFFADDLCFSIDD